MKRAVASLIRNEIDIIGALLQHLHGLLMDHGSIDGTDRAIGAAVARQPGCNAWHIELIGYQTTFDGFPLRHLLQHMDADVAMCLDVDEFINTPDRLCLFVAFAQLTDPDRIGDLGWRNAAPGRTDTRAINPGEPVWLRPVAGQFGELVIPRRYHARRGSVAHLGIGKHFLFPPPMNRVPADRVGAILRLPFTYPAQRQDPGGALSVLAQAQRPPAQRWHWHDILYRICEGTLRGEHLVGIAVHYGEAGRQSSTRV